MVSEGLGKMSDFLEKVSYGLRKISDGLLKPIITHYSPLQPNTAPDCTHFINLIQLYQSLSFSLFSAFFFPFMTKSGEQGENVTTL